eukprot:gene2577-5031_t
MFFAVQKNVQKFGDQIAQTFVDLAKEVSADWDPSEAYGALWEPNENADSCRDCGVKFQLLIVKKQHCRVCAGIFCDNCTRIVDSSSPRAVQKSSQSDDNSCPIKICDGCRRNETPGEIIRNNVRSILDKEKQSDRDEGKQSAGKNAPNVDDIAMKVALKMGGAIGANFNAFARAIPCPLNRYSIHGEDGRPAATKGPLPANGYLEIRNKSTEFFAVKVLFPGTNHKFEVPRPSYMAVPPGQTVSASFDPEDRGITSMDIFILYSNPSPIETGSSLIYDTKGSNVNVSSIAPCARIDGFRRAVCYSAPCAGKNILLKYKGYGAIEPRRGDSIGRVGVVGKISGKRGTKHRIDYSTNIDTIEIAFSC